MSETIKLCAMLARAVFENDDEAREPFVEQAMRAKREHDEMRRNLDAADTTRREWEVRAATSYAAGRKAGLREAAALLERASKAFRPSKGCDLVRDMGVAVLALAAEPRDEGES